MAGIRNANTAPEMTVRRFLHSRGFRFRLHDRRLPGRPDIVLTRWNAVVQVQGCFWHAHEGCPFFVIPSTRRSFWEVKLFGNRQRDLTNQKILIELGWRAAIVWECALRSAKDDSLRRLEKWLRNGRSALLELSG